jgi:acetyl-CoA acetyltransferase
MPPAAAALVQIFPTCSNAKICEVRPLFRMNGDSLMSVRGQFAIVGLGMTEQGLKLGRTSRDLRADAVQRALNDAGLERDAIDGYIHCWSEREDLRFLGLSPNFSLAIQTGGATPAVSILTAIGMINSGQAEIVACVYGYSASAGYVRPGLTLKNIGAVAYGYPSLFGMVGPAASHALHARRHMDLYGTTSEQMGAVAVTLRDYAKIRPGTLGFGKPITLADHQVSPMIADPLHRLDCCRDTDGGAAILITSADRAKTLGSKPIYILGGGTGHNIVNWHNGSVYEHHDNIRPAADRAFRMAGMTIEDIDVTQLYDPFTISVIMQLEEYGVIPYGQGGPFAAEGGLRADGKMPTNTGGGQLSAFYAAGFTPLAEAIWQLRGDAGPGQLRNVNTALVSGHGLNAGVQNTWAHATLILGNEP